MEGSGTGRIPRSKSLYVAMVAHVVWLFEKPVKVIWFSGVEPGAGQGGRRAFLTCRHQAPARLIQFWTVIRTLASMVRLAGVEDAGGAVANEGQRHR